MTIDHRPSTIDHRPSTIDHRPSTIDHLTTNRFRSAFTLIEMMVVIGIIALLAYGAAPGIKKAYEDFQLRKDLEFLDMLISSTRTYELVMNEYPHLSFEGRWAWEANWTLPRYFTSGTPDVGGTIGLLGSWLKVKPHLGNSYIINQQLTDNNSCFYMGVFGGNGAYNSFLTERYPTYTISGDVLYFPELSHMDQELQIHRNRYY